ncbi:E3 ubiquitin-protein ligase RNF43-like [Sesamum indicum]|uniref:RING-type E3 ubiquitin transferase n=1 Tax=Sesamum indicum TaxID=4182 RepID=A0A6I9TQY5_SESIN|nr:E3 ubiquitin-protein ligase RNF43-like [Sesamum indicum]
MAPPAWLPPLNSHQESFINVDMHESYARPRIGDVKLMIELHVHVDFYSEKDVGLKLAFPGFFITQRRPINMKNHEALEESLWDLIQDEDLIPFELLNCFWTDWTKLQLHSRQWQLLLLTNEDELVEKISDFLHLVHSKPKNKDMMAWVRLEIRKIVKVPVEEFASWISWFDEQKRIDPTFESEYSKAIRRPRDMSEVHQEAESLMARRPAKIINGELQIVAVNGGKDDDGASMLAKESCSICLEGFFNGGRATRLPCSHMFHENCILRWLRENHVCPLCRYELPIDE